MGGPVAVAHAGGMTDFKDAADRDGARNAINREYYAIRRSLRSLAADEQQLERRLEDLAAQQRRTRAAADAASQAEPPLGGRPDRRS